MNELGICVPKHPMFPGKYYDSYLNEYRRCDKRCAKCENDWLCTECKDVSDVLLFGTCMEYCFFYDMDNLFDNEPRIFLDLELMNGHWQSDIDYNEMIFHLYYAYNAT